MGHYVWQSDAEGVTPIPLQTKSSFFFSLPLQAQKLPAHPDVLWTRKIGETRRGM